MNRNLVRLGAALSALVAAGTVVAAAPGAQAAPTGGGVLVAAAAATAPTNIASAVKATRRPAVVLSVPATVAPGQRATVRVSTSKAHVGRRVVVQYSLAGRWYTHRVITVPRSRTAAYSLVTPGTTRLRAVVVNSRGRAVALSPTRTITVVFGRPDGGVGQGGSTPG